MPGSSGAVAPLYRATRRNDANDDPKPTSTAFLIVCAFMAVPGLRGLALFRPLPHDPPVVAGAAARPAALDLDQRKAIGDADAVAPGVAGDHALAHVIAFK